MNCATVDDLAAAYAVGAVDADEELAVSEHLATCSELHAESRELIGVAAAVPVTVDDVSPSPALRDRLMATVAATPQDHAPTRAPAVAGSAPVTDMRGVPGVPNAPARPRWSLRGWGALPGAVAAAALAAAVGLGAWGLSLNAQLAERDDVLRAVATADAAFAVAGSAGSGWVLETDGRAVFIADALAVLPEGRLYELWLIGPDGVPAAAGTVADTDGVTVVELEDSLEAPTSEPVLLATLEG
jgi:anti-sigma-K factor RskA